MGGSRYALRDVQVELLRRIGGPAEPVTSAESGIATSVRALRWRGYVRMVFQGKAWTAEITEVGRFYLAHGCHPRDAGPDTPGLPVAAGALWGQQSKRADPVQDGVAGLLGELSGVELRGLAARLLSAETVRLTHPSPVLRKQLIGVAAELRRDRRIVAAGRKVRFRGRHTGDIELWLEDALQVGPEVLPIPLVAVNPDMNSPHPMVRAAQKAGAAMPIPAGECRIIVYDTSCLHLRVSPQALPRALSLGQAVFDEALRRGYTVASSPRGEYRPGWPQCGGACIVADGMPFEYTLWETYRLQPYEPSPKDMARLAENPWAAVPKLQRVPTGMLEMRWGHGMTVVADVKTMPLEDKIGIVFEDLDRRVASAVRRAARSKAADEHRAQQREREMAEARTQFVSDHLDERFLAQVNDWTKAAAIRGYCDALQSHLSAAGGKDAATLREWIARGCELADRMDPTVPRPAVPAMPSPTVAELAVLVTRLRLNA